MTDQATYTFTSPHLTAASMDYSTTPSSSRLHDTNNSSQRPYFLSLDLTTQRLGLIIVDEHLDVILADEINFDSDLPEYCTQQGCQTDGESSTLPIHMYVKALDMLLIKVSAKVELQRVKCISGSAQQQTLVWWSKAASTLLSRLAPQKTLHDQLPFEQTWTLPNPPNNDATTPALVHSLEWMIGGSERMAQRTGGRAFYRSAGVQIMKVQQTRPNILDATDRISLSSSFLASLFLGCIAPLSESEAASMGLWNMSGRHWDRLVLGLIMGSPSTKTDVTAEATRLMEKLGEANMDSSTPLGPIASYFVRRYGFSSDCQIASFVSHHLAMFLSHSAGKRDAVICLGDPDSDAVLLPILDYLPDTFRQILPYPAWSPVQANAAGDFSQVALLEFKDADLARYFVRDAYCNASWQTFDTLVNLIAEGGTIGLDDKLYSFFWSHGEFGNWQGISKFEGGQRVEEFKDLRANPRSLLESQFLRMRIQLARVNQALKKPAHPTESPPFPYSLLGFDPYDHSVLPERIIILGRASENRVMVDLLSSVLGAPVYRSAPSPVSPFFSGVECAITTSGLGACYKAAWTHSHLHNLTCSYDDFLREKVAQRTNRRKASRFDEGKSSVPIITRSIASLETQQDPAISSSQQLLPSIQSTRRLWNEISASSEVQSNESTSGMLLNPDTNGTEVDLIQIAEPDEDMFRRYGGQAEEYTRLESFVLRGIL